MKSIPSELNSSGFKDGKDDLDMTNYLGYVTYDVIFQCFLNVIVLCVSNSKIGKRMYELLAMVLIDNFHALDWENIR